MRAALVTALRHLAEALSVPSPQIHGELVPVRVRVRSAADPARHLRRNGSGDEPRVGGCS